MLLALLLLTNQLKTLYIVLRARQKAAVNCERVSGGRNVLTSVATAITHSLSLLPQYQAVRRARG